MSAAMSKHNKEDVKLKIVEGGKRLQINNSSIFPAMYIRDNCPQSFHATTFHREIPVWDLPPDLTITKVCHASNHDVRITYSDGYISYMPLHFFERYSPKRLSSRQPDSKLRQWKAKDMLLKGLPSYNFNDIIMDDRVLLQFLNSLTSYGVAKVNNCKTLPGQLEKITKRFGFIRETNYGKIFEVRVEPNALNQAYTSKALPLHTDLPFYSNPPGIQLLHCLVQCADTNKGGRSILADGLAVAQKMKIEMPRLYQRLVDSKVVFADKANNGEFFMKFERAVIKERDGMPYEINYNNHVRSTELYQILEEMEETYEAIREFGKLAHSPEFLYEIRLEPGEMLAFSNKRVLHGRRAIVMDTSKPSEGRSRWLQGCYVDLDEVRSKQRCLANTMTSSRL